MGVRVIVSDLDAVLEGFLRFPLEPLFPVADAEVVPGDVVLVVGGNRLQERGDRLVKAALFAINDAEVGGGKGIPGIDFDGFFQSHFRGGKFPRLDLGDPEIGEGEVVVRSRVHNLLVEFLGVGEASLCEEFSRLVHHVARGVRQGFRSLRGRRHRESASWLRHGHGNVERCGIRFAQRGDRLLEKQALVVREPECGAGKNGQLLRDGVGFDLEVLNFFFQPRARGIPLGLLLDLAEDDPAEKIVFDHRALFVHRWLGVQFQPGDFPRGIVEQLGQVFDLVVPFGDLGLAFEKPVVERVDVAAEAGQNFFIFRRLRGRLGQLLFGLGEASGEDLVFSGELAEFFVVVRFGQLRFEILFILGELRFFLGELRLHVLLFLGELRLLFRELGLQIFLFLRQFVDGGVVVLDPFGAGGELVALAGDLFAVLLKNLPAGIGGLDVF